MKRIPQDRSDQTSSVHVDQLKGSNGAANDQEIEEQIRRRAYQLFQDRGEVPGFEVQDWLQAEAEILGTERRSKAA